MMFISQEFLRMRDMMSLYVLESTQARLAVSLKAQTRPHHRNPLMVTMVIYIDSFREHYSLMY